MIFFHHCKFYLYTRLSMGKKLDIFLNSKNFSSAVNLLNKNNSKEDFSQYTIPSKNLYTHQWSWDSGWIAYGYCGLEDIQKAESELLSLFNYQWKNGLVPSIIFHNLENNTYWPSPDVWNLNEKAKHLTNKSNSTGIIQPPIHSSAVYNIYQTNKNKVQAKEFLNEIYDKLLLWHNYLYNERDINNEGLAFIRHPWESGMDNSPIWDASLERIKIKEYKYSKYRTDNKKVNSEERPTDITYERYISLIELFKEYNYNEKEIYNNSEFIIQDVLFNVLLLKSNYALLNIAEILEKTSDYKVIKTWIEKTNIGLEKLYYKGFYYDFDMKSNQIIPTKTITGLTAILFSNKTEELVFTLEKEFLNLDNDNYSISSLSRYDKNFDSINYWRGPMWTNLTWLITSGLKQKNYHKLAHKININCIKKIEDLGFFEYFDSNGILGCGDNHFSWTAAVYICLILNLQF